MSTKTKGAAIVLSKTPGFTQIRWSPDSKYLVGWRLLPGDRRQVHLLASSRRAQTRAQLESRMYDQPGDVLDRYEPYVFNVEAKSEIKIPIDPITAGGQPWSAAPGIDWRGSRFVVDFHERGYQRYHVVQIDVGTAKPKHLVDEAYPTFFDTTSTILRFLQKSDEFLWRSEQDGWGHLYLRDGSTGAVKNQVTKGEWVVRTVVDVDETARTVTFLANGREKGDPYLQYLYRVNFDGTNLTLLTPSTGNHRLNWSPTKSTFIDSYSQVDAAPVHEWRRADGSLIVELERADVSGLRGLKLKDPEVFVSKGRDGKTDIWGIVVRPTN